MRTIGKVKWFDPLNGFGVVVTGEDTSASLDASVLALAGRATIAPGTPLVIDIVLKSNGLAVTCVHSIGEPPAPDGANVPPRSEQIIRDQTAAVITGMCKWFSRPKGYGFISPAGGGEDVFVEMTTLRQAGVKELRQGQRVVFEAARGPKGPIVTRIIGA